MEKRENLGTQEPGEYSEPSDAVSTERIDDQYATRMARAQKVGVQGTRISIFGPDESGNFN